MNPAVMMNDTLFNTLNDWVDRYYRDRLVQADLVDPQLLREGRRRWMHYRPSCNWDRFIRSSAKEMIWKTYWR